MPDAAAMQADFIRFLGDVMMAGIFQGSEYAAVGKATEAYLAARLLLHPFGVGYMDHGEYQTIQIVDPGFDGNTYLPFDQLGEAS